jgi:hypothetical protein
VKLAWSAEPEEAATGMAAAGELSAAKGLVPARRLRMRVGSGTAASLASFRWL